MKKSPRRRRKHSDEFKAMLVNLCREPDASVAAIAMDHRINDNLLRRWLREASDARQPDPIREASAPCIVPVHLAAPLDTTPAIRIHLQQGDTQIHVEWPASSALECGQWLKDMLR